MGNIVIANMQAYLTLDSRAFEEGADKAEARLDQIEQRISNLPGEAKSNVGADGGDEKRQREARKAERLSEVAEMQAVQQQIQSAQANTVNVETTQLRQRSQAFDNFVQKQVESYVRLGAEMDAVVSKAHTMGEAISRPLQLPAPPERLALPAPAVPLQLMPPRRPEKLGPGVAFPPGADLDQIYKDILAPYGGPASTVTPKAAAGNWWTQPGAGGDDWDAIEQEAAEKRAQAQAQAAVTAAQQGTAPAKPKYYSGSAAYSAELTEEQKLNIKFLANQTLGQSTDEQLQAIQAHAQGLGGANVLQAIDVYNQALDDYAKQSTPAAIERQILATAQAEDRIKKGIPHDPIDRMLQKQGKLDTKVLDPDDLDPTQPKPDPTPGGRGSAQAISYQRYMALNTPAGAITQSFLGGLSPELAQVVPAFAGATLAAVAFAAALAEGSKAAIEESKQVFQLNDTLVNATPDFDGNTEAINKQLEAYKALGFSGKEVRGEYAQLVETLHSTSAAQMDLRLAMDISRGSGVSLQQVIGDLQQMEEGHAGSLHKYMSSLNEGDPANFARAALQQRFGGDALEFMDTAAGKAERVRAEWDSALESMGESMLPGLVNAADALTKIMPLLTGVGTIVGTVVSGVSETVGFFADIAAGSVATPFSGVEESAGSADTIVKELNKDLEEHLRLQGLLRGDNEEKDYGSFGNLGEQLHKGALNLTKGTNPEYLLTGRITEERDGRIATRQFDNPSFEEAAERYARFVASQNTPPWQDPTTSPLYQQTQRDALARLRAQGVDPGLRANSASTTPGAAGAANMDLVNQAESISQIRAVQEQMTGISTATQGVQQAFESFETFHFDYNVIRDKVKEFKVAVQQLYTDFDDISQTAQNGAPLDVNRYNMLVNYLKGVSSVAGMIVETTQAFTVLYESGAPLPDNQKITALKDNVQAWFDAFESVAEAEFPQGLGPNGGADIGLTQMDVYVQAANHLFEMLSSASTVMEKIYSLPVPDSARVTRYVDALVDMTKQVSAKVNEAFILSSESNSASARGGSPFTDREGGLGSVGLGNAAAISEHAAKLMQFAQSGIGVLEKLHGLNVPSPNEVKTAIDRVMGIIPQIVAAMNDQAKDTSNDAVLMEAGKRAENATKLVQLAEAGVQVFASMRGLHVPDPARIQDVVTGTFEIVTDAFKALPPQDPELEARAKAWAESAGALVQVIMGSTEVFANMRGLRVPTPGELDNVTKGTQYLVKSLVSLIPEDGQVPDLIDEGEWAGYAGALVNVVGSAVGTFVAMRGMHIPSDTAIDETVNATVHLVDRMATMAIPKGQNGDALIEAGKWADDAGKLVQVFQGGVQSFVSMRGMHIPAQQAIDATAQGIHELIDSMTSRLPADADIALIAAGKWAEDAGKIVQVYESGVNVFHGMRNMHVPSAGAIQAFVSGVGAMLADTMPLTTVYSDAALIKAKEWAESMGPLVGVLEAGVNTLGALRHLHEPGMGQMRAFHTMLTEMLNEFMGATDDWNYMALDRAKEWGESMGPFVGALSGGADALQKIRDLREPSVRALTEFRDTFGVMVNELMRETTRYGYEQVDRAKEWGEAMQAVLGAADTGADVLLKLRDLHEPSVEAIDSFMDMNEYMSQRFIQMSQQVGPDMAASMEEYGQSLQQAFGGLNAAESFLMNLPKTAFLPESMIDAYFENLDQTVDLFHDHAEKWAKDMSFERSNFSVDLGNEMEALGKAADLFNKMGTFRVDYRAQVNMLFDNLRHIIPEFKAGAERWKTEMDEGTHTVSLYMGEEMDAINKALDPLTKMDAASQVMPGMIPVAFQNIDRMVLEFGNLANRPELQGEKLGKLTQFSAQVQGIFGAINEAATAANEIGQGQTLGSADFTGYLDGFFLKSVPAYADEWENQMNRIAGSAEGMSARVGDALGSLPVQVGTPQAATDRNTRQVPGSIGNNNTFSNCVIVNGTLQSTDADVNTILQKITKTTTVKNGGVPVNATPLR